MKGYGYFTFPFLVPGTNVCKRENYYNWDQRCRMQCQIRFKEQQLEQQVSKVGFRAVDVKELEE